MKLKNLFWKGKKGSISTTFVWIIAFGVIIFMMIMFFVIVGFYSAEIYEKFEGSLYEVKVYEGRYESGIYESFFGLLNTLVEINNREIKIIDAIEMSLDPYYEREELEDLKNDLNSLKYQELLSKEIFVAIQEDSIDSELFSGMQEALDFICDKYVLVIPQGAIVEDEDNFISGQRLKILEEELGKEFYFVNFGNWVVIEIPYKDQVIEIKYKQLRECFKDE